METLEQRRLNRRLREQYNGALKQIIAENKAFLQKVQDVRDGKIAPPQYYVDNDIVDKWRQGFERQLMRKYAVQQRIADDLKQCGKNAAGMIQQSMYAEWEQTRVATIADISNQAAAAGLRATFAQYDRRQIKVLLTDNLPPFTKIAYRNLGQNKKVVARLQNEMMQSILLGEPQTKLIKRIRDVVGNAEYNARRTAQTERNRVQSQARQMCIDEAAQQGIRLAKQWSTDMDGRERETHGALDGWVINEGDTFPNGLAYPCDPHGEASEIINCRCVLIPIVLKSDEVVQSGRIVKNGKAQQYHKPNVNGREDNDTNKRKSNAEQIIREAWRAE